MRFYPWQRVRIISSNWLNRPHLDQLLGTYKNMVKAFFILLWSQLTLQRPLRSLKKLEYLKQA